MIRAFTADQVRAAEAPLLEAGEPLMQRAAFALAQRALAHLRRGREGSAGQKDAGPTRARTVAGARVLVLAGAGDNGGDGLFAAALLRRRGVAADALAVLGRHHEEGAAALRARGGRVFTRLDELPVRGPISLVLDAITGIGGRPELSPALRELLDTVRDLDAPVLAVDVPSGIDATTGAADPGALAARETVTFGAVKTGLLLPGGADLAGNVHLVDIGLGPHMPERPALERLETADAAALWPTPGRGDDKYSRGVVEIAAGSETYPGAAVLSVSGAARAGAGMVRLDAPRSVLDLVLARRPEVVGGEGKHQARVVGSGVPEDDPRLARALADLRTGHRPHERTRLPGVVDAGALGAVGTGDGGALDGFHPGVVLTPHAGEAARLARALGIDPEQPAPDLARALAEATGATVLLKGAVTIIAPSDPSEPLLSQDDATSQLATAGAGDVLGGVLGSLLAAGLPGPRAAALAALVHGRAARDAALGGTAPIAALDVAEHLPRAVATILAGADRRPPADEAGGA
ncbi:NAD(P)H-hydrate epimerase [Brachybacterium halotolerans subsp. kimchii]|uniref:NAD(P)H-hydrate epimerase n=1 Tax=Brachybacterium halotolerans TaxID=2795215 RepID=UPI001E53C228|nr:NAD(P)H-hydrate epimerase [Brachybacterium halotolerans]UEJ82365.1 NAD(P)H-hydrate epimerase [Brachybacterium halotolerans subsp. kimchii]